MFSSVFSSRHVYCRSVFLSSISSSLLLRSSSSLPSLSSSSLSSSPLLSTSSLLSSSVRQFSFMHFHDENDPDITLRHAREVKRKEKEAGAKFSSKYLGALISVAIGHYQKKDYKMARRCALYAHDMVVDHRSSTHTLAYFSAVTVARCNRALAQEMSKILDNRKEASNFGGKGGRVNNNNNDGMIDDDMMQSTLVIRDEGKRFSSLGEMVAYYHAEAEQFERLSRRILELPDKYFMRTDSQHREANSQETSGSSSDHDKAYSSADFKNSNSASSSSSSGNGSASTGFGMESLKHMKRRMKDEAEGKRKSFDATQRRSRTATEYAIRKEFTKESRTYRSDMPHKASGSPTRFSSQSLHRKSKGKTISSIFATPR